MDEFFWYGETEIEYLKTKDKKMAQCKFQTKPFLQFGTKQKAH